jgi:hypothetical protein
MLARDRFVPAGMVGLACPVPTVPSWLDSGSDWKRLCLRGQWAWSAWLARSLLCPAGLTADQPGNVIACVAWYR